MNYCLYLGRTLACVPVRSMLSENHRNHVFEHIWAILFIWWCSRYKLCTSFTFHISFKCVAYWKNYAWPVSQQVGQQVGQQGTYTFNIITWVFTCVVRMEGCTTACTCVCSTPWRNSLDSVSPTPRETLRLLARCTTCKMTITRCTLSSGVSSGEKHHTNMKGVNVYLRQYLLWCMYTSDTVLSLAGTFHNSWLLILVDFFITRQKIIWSRWGPFLFNNLFQDNFKRDFVNWRWCSVSVFQLPRLQVSPGIGDCSADVYCASLLWVHGEGCRWASVMYI